MRRSPTARHYGTAADSKRKDRFKPLLQPLEERTVPDAVTWNVDQGGDWSDASKWSPHAPSAGDDVTIPFSDIQVTHNTGSVDFINSLTSSAALAISAGTLSVASDSTISNTLTLSGGTLSGGGDLLTINGAFVWSGGTLSGSNQTVIANGGIILSGFSVTLATQLENAGFAFMTGPSSSLNLTANGNFTNMAGALFEIRNDQGVFGTDGTFVNEGQVIRDLSTGVAQINSVFTNVGMVTIDTGELGLFGRNSIESGIITTSGSPGAKTLALSGDQTFTNGSSVLIDDVVVTGGTATFGGRYEVTDSTTVTGSANATWQGGDLASAGTTLTVASGQATFNSGHTLTFSEVNLSGGRLTGSDPISVNSFFNWYGGELRGSGRMDVNGFLNLGGFGVTLGRTLNNNFQGSLDSPNSSLFIDSGATFTNATDAMFTLLNNQSISGPGTFHNLGHIFREFETGTMTISSVFNNDGTVEVRTGTLNLAGNGSHTGSFSGLSEFPDAVLEFGGGTQTLRAGSSVTVPNVVFAGAAVTVNDNPSQTAVFHVTTSTMVTSGTVNFTAGADVDLGDPFNFNQLIVRGGTATFNDGATLDVYSLELSGGTLTGRDNINEEHVFLWYGGTLNGTGSTEANGLIEMFGFGVTLGRTLDVNYGAIVWGPNASIFINRIQGDANNNGVLNVQAGAGLALRNDMAISGAGTLHILAGGVLSKEESSGDSIIQTNVQNDGTVDVQSGALSFGGASNDYTGNFTGAPGTSLVFAGASHFEPGSNVTGANVLFNGSGAVTVDGLYSATESTTFNGGVVDFNNQVSNLGARLAIANGTANFNAGGSVDLTWLSMTGGNLNGGLNITVDGAAQWWGGAMSGGSSAVTTINGVLDLSGFGKTLNRTLSLNGYTLWTGTGDLGLTADAVINNQGTFDVQNNQNLGTQTGVGTFNNFGTFQKTNSWGTTTVWAHFNNLGGFVNVQTGTVVFESGGPNPFLPGPPHGTPVNSLQAPGDSPVPNGLVANSPSEGSAVPPQVDRSEGVRGASTAHLQASAHEAFAELFEPEILTAWGALHQP
jgi:hypothetical protein